MRLLAAEKISKSYLQKTLLSDSSFYLNEGDKVGVVGINGTGKSTFLKILAGLEQPDSGTIIKTEGVRIGYLPQNPDFGENCTVLEQVFKGASKELKELKTYEAETILTKLGITEFDKDVNRLSGGQKKRVAIASALINPCDILILDEPTNHIDNDMVLWLEKYLAKYTGAIIMVTHDRYFLDRVTNKIAELDRGNLYLYEANYSKYVEMKAEREEMELGTERKRKSLLRKELEWMMRGPRARGTKSKSRIERFEELSGREGPASEQKLDLASVSTRLGRKTVEINHISKGFGGRKLIADFDTIILRDARIGIVGQNGCGKSTLLKMISGEVEPDSGTVVLGDTVKLGYFSQECEEMDTSLRVIDYIRGIAENIVTVDGTLTASQMLEKFLFPGDLQWNTIGKLSGGERRRLFLLRILMDAPNILLLDEPSNDLDITTLTILEDYLEQFKGAVVVVSHDRYFLDKVVDRVFAFEEGGRLKGYLGGYSNYLEATQLQEQEKKARTPEKGKSPEQSIKRAPSKPAKPKFSYKEQQEFNEIDNVLEQLNRKLEDIHKKIEEEASNYTRLEELTVEKEEVERELEEKTERWVYLYDLSEKIEQANS